MRGFASLIGLLWVSLLFGSARGEELVTSMPKLLVGIPGGIISIDLNSGVTSDAINAPLASKPLFSGSRFSRISSQRFLLQVEQGNSGFGIFDAQSGSIHLIDELGGCPVYIPAANSIMYFKSQKNESFTGQKGEYGYYAGVFVRPLSGMESERLIYKLKMSATEVCPMPISDHEVVFYQDFDAVKLLRHDFKTGETVPYSLGNCKPVMGLGRAERFLCTVDEGYAIREVDGRVTMLPADVTRQAEMVPMAYVPEIDSLLITELGFSLFSGETRSLWIYDIPKKQKRLLRKGISVNPNAAFYLQR